MDEPVPTTATVSLWSCRTAALALRNSLESLRKYPGISQACSGPAAAPLSKDNRIRTDAPDAFMPRLPRGLRPASSLELPDCAFRHLYTTSKEQRLQS